MSKTIKTKQLEIMLHEFQLLSKTILTQLQIAAKIMENNAIEDLVEEAEENEIIIDRLEIKIREEVVFSIFKFNPVAADLRLMIAYQDLTTNLERMGDVLLNVIHRLCKHDFGSAEFETLHKQLEKMLKYVTEMTRNAILAFDNQDAEVAYTVIKEDDKVDELFRQFKVTLQNNYVNRQLTAEDIKGILDISSIAYYLERIGDSATNVAESAVYFAEGKDIRHGNKE